MFRNCYIVCEIKGVKTIKRGFWNTRPWEARVVWGEKASNFHFNKISDPTGSLQGSDINLGWQCTFKNKTKLSAFLKSFETNLNILFQ